MKESKSLKIASCWSWSQHDAKWTTNKDEMKLISKQSGTKQLWSAEEVRDLLWCYLYSEKLGKSSYLQVYDIWRERNPHNRLHIDAKKLSNQLRYLKKKVKTMAMVAKMKKDIEEELQKQTGVEI